MTIDDIKIGSRIRPVIIHEGMWSSEFTAYMEKYNPIFIVTKKEVDNNYGIYYIYATNTLSYTAEFNKKMVFSISKEDIKKQIELVENKKILLKDMLR